MVEEVDVVARWLQLEEMKRTWGGTRAAGA